MVQSVYNPFQMVEKFRLVIPHIRKDPIVWYRIHMATINNKVIEIDLSEWKMMDVVQFRFAKKRQHPHAPIEYIASDQTLLRYLSGAKRRSWESDDGGRTWREIPGWSSYT